MKLNKENFTKTIDKDIVRYSYNCNDTNFYLELVGQNKGRTINVFSGSLEDKQNLLSTTNSLEAWSYFEDLLKVCNSEQGSSGGGNLGDNPQQNPNILPLLAISGSIGGMTKITLFALMDDKSQTKIFDFEVDSSTMPQPIPNNVFTVDWSGEDITQLLKCEVILKEFGDIKFEEEPSSKVFVFIPKSMVNQGGEEGGNTQKGEEPGDQPGNEPRNEPGNEPGNEYGQPTDEPGNQPSDKPGDQPSDKPGDQPSDKPSDKPSDEKGEKQEDGKPNGYKNEPKPLNFSDTIQQLANATDGEYNPSELLSIFRNIETGEVWLSSNNFPKIKKELNLPPSTTPRQFSQQIINSK